MDIKTNKYLIVALLIGLTFHGTSIFFTLENTYDAFIHLFFADHYTNSWFEPWNYSWYTGFTVMSYPPLVHQVIALLSLLGGLKFGLFSVAIISVLLFITGVYKFSLLITSNKKVAGYSAILAVFSSSFIEALHLFGQLPSIIGISILMHALPEIYNWLKTGRYRYLFSSLSLIAVTVSSHHVTPIFGMIFFIFPLIGIVLMDASKEQVHSMKAVTFAVFLRTFYSHFRRIVGFGTCSLIIILACILPYWINTKNNPITQVPIPHGSRDHFIEVSSSGLVFFLIPWGILLLLLPYVYYRFFSKRYLFFGLSITLLTVLGTGETTPIPKIMLGENAFNILTLDRFTFWATIMSLPIFGEFVYRFVELDLKILFHKKLGAVYHRIFGGILAALFIFTAVFTLNLGYFRPAQPQKIKMQPIVNFLSQDQHDQWRYLTLGFGDQMAWLSTQTNAMTVDGNYHSARRLPELTTKAIERLENSKFKGIEGIGSLQQFLTVPEKYNLKYIFSNDKFYDPILYFCGWQRLPKLENGIQVWEKLNVPPISSILPKENIPLWQKIIWGLIPLLTVIVAFILCIQLPLLEILKNSSKIIPEYFNFKTNYSSFSNIILKVTHIWIVFIALVFCFACYQFYIKNSTHHSPENVVKAYYDALDFKNFNKAFTLINPNDSITKAQYMLEMSLSDGLLSSYAKLDRIEVKTLSKVKNTAKVIIDTDWITPLEKIHKTTYKTIIKHKSKWYVKLDKLDSDIPPDQLFTHNSTSYFNQGRRRITTEQTYHEDILKQPVLEILSAKLIKVANQYAIVGEIQNIDNVPADVVLKGTLYSNKNKTLATFNAKYLVKHKLMPKEMSSFKIDFEDIAWKNNEDVSPRTFNPDEFTVLNLEEDPVNFDLHVVGNVANKDLYKSVTLNALKIDKDLLRGTLFNSGINEVVIPQLLISYYDEYKNIVWVDHTFIQYSIRQQRKHEFEYAFINGIQIKVINDDMKNCFVNGLPNEAISNKIVPNRIISHQTNMLQPINNKDFHFIKIEVNNYIGNFNN